MKNEKLPRGVHRRGNSLGLKFALADGVIERRSLGPVSVKYALEQLAIYKRQVREGTYEKRQKRPAVYKVGDVFEPYMVEFANRGRRAPQRWRYAWKRLEPFFGALAVGEVTTSALNEYIAARRADGCQPATINRELALLKAMFRFGTRQTPVMVDRVPAFPARLQESKPRQGFVTGEQYTRLASRAKQLWLRTFIACAYTFGFRVGELLNLRVAQIDLAEQWITLERGTTKNGEARRVKMTAEVHHLLAALVAGRQASEPVFVREDGGAVRDPRKAWYDLCVRCGLGKLIPVEGKHKFHRYVGLNLHDFRRSAVRNLVRAGVSERVAMEISGHKTRSVFDRYDIVDERDLTRASQLLEAAAESDTKTDTSVRRVPQVIDGRVAQLAEQWTLNP